MRVAFKPSSTGYTQRTPRAPRTHTQSAAARENATTAACTRRAWRASGPLTIHTSCTHTGTSGISVWQQRASGQAPAVVVAAAAAAAAAASAHHEHNIVLLR